MANFNFTSKNIQSRGIYEETCHISAMASFRGFVSIGSYSYIGDRSWISNSIIGNFSWIETNVELGRKKVFPDSFSNHSFTLSEGNYLFPDESYTKIITDRFFYHKQPLILIGNDVRICKNSMIQSGITIGNGALILPNSVVYSDIEPYAIVAGNPARVIGYRFDKNLISEIDKLDWPNLDFSSLKLIKRVNYLDVNYVINLIKSASLKKRIELNRMYDSCLNVQLEDISNIAIQGPSHINKWVRAIQNREVEISKHLMFGEVGLSIFSKSFRNFEKWWLERKNNKLIFFVPDFRIGNSSSIEGKDNHDGLFIQKELIDPLIDKKIYDKSLDLLDQLVLKYGNKIQLLFWCLFAREKMNIREMKYTNLEFYQHPTWNYTDIIKRYPNNTINLEDHVDDIFKYIELDGTMHPNINGFKLLSKIFKNINL